VIIEYFTGTINQQTGVLEPKSFVDRYARPPYSLGFSILVNPAMGSVNRLLSNFVDIKAAPIRTFRLIVFLQPLMSHIEGWVCASIRRTMRSATFVHLFSGKPTNDLETTHHMLAAASRFADEIAC